MCDSPEDVMFLDGESPGDSSSKSQNSPVSQPDDQCLVAQDRVRKWLHESPELKLTLNSGSGSSQKGPKEVRFLTEEEAEMYPDDDRPLIFGNIQGCFGLFSCLKLKNRR